MENAKDVKGQNLTRFERLFNEILHSIGRSEPHRPIGLGMAMIALSLHDLADAIRAKTKERSKEDGRSSQD